MAAAVARRYGDRFLASVAPQPNESAEDVITANRLAFRAALDRDGRMCLCGVLGAEAGVLSTEVTAEVQSFFRRCIDDLARRIGGPDALSRAFHVMATLEGAMVLARAYGDIDAFDQANRGLRDSPPPRASFGMLGRDHLRPAFHTAFT